MMVPVAANRVYYDAVGNRTEVRDARGNRWSFTYDAVNRNEAQIDPLGNRTTYTYDAANRQTVRKDATNVLTSYTYDANNQLVTIVYPSSRVTYAYDDNGRMTKMQDVNGIVTYNYDAVGRIASSVDSYSRQLTYTYDGIGNRLTMDAPNSGRTTYVYDAINRVTSILNPYAEITTIVWDSLSREQKRTLGNGAVISHTYDAAGRETMFELRKSDGTARRILTFTYDNVSNPLSRFESDGTRITYTYDDTYQLTNENRTGGIALNWTYIYDAAGNRASLVADGSIYTYTNDAANQLTVITPPTGGLITTLTYDAKGNHTVEHAGSYRYTNTWDEENRFIKKQYSTVPNPFTMTYRPDGKRIKSELFSGGVNQFLWDDENLLQIHAGDGSLGGFITDYPGYWGGLASWRNTVTPATYFGAFDPSGNAAMYLDASQLPVSTGQYTAFGVELSNAVLYSFGGQYGYYDDESTRLYVRARNYWTAWGRWMSRDPIGFDGGDWNLYGYVGKQPYIFC